MMDFTQVIGAAVALASFSVAQDEPPAKGTPASTTQTQKSASKSPADSTSDARLREISKKAYVYGYPLLIMDVTKKISTNVAAPANQKAPINQFGHMKKFPDASFTDVVNPNADTLYSPAWLDLSAEPVVLSVPAAGKRFYMMPMLDAYTNVFSSPGTRTTGTQAKNFAIVGPNWKGRLPSGVTKIQAPTPMVWIIGRTHSTGGDDLAPANAFQDGLKLTPLSSWGKAYTPPPGKADPNVSGAAPMEQVSQMNGATFFARMCELMKENRPKKADQKTVNTFAAIGIHPDGSCRVDALNDSQKTALDEGAKLAQTEIDKAAKGNSAKLIRGWNLPLHGGTYGTNYLLRAAIAKMGLGMNLPKDAIYGSAHVDATGADLDSQKKYTIRFEKNQMPPVNAFWSVTIVDDKYRFASNSVNRHKLGSDTALRFNNDGSLVLYLQKEKPEAGEESNWLPLPEGGHFSATLRMYWPKESVLKGQWKPPGIMPVREAPALAE